MTVRIGEIASVRSGLNRSGRAPGARPGPQTIRVVSGGDIRDDRIVLSGLETAALTVDSFIEPHLLRPGDVLVTGKSTSVKAALVPADIGPAVANSTMLVIRPREPSFGTLIWWFLTSRRGRREAESRMLAGAALSSLPPYAVADIEMPLPGAAEMAGLVELIEASEQAYRGAQEAASIRREIVRDHIIDGLVRAGEPRRVK
ncbi:MAG: hypothetical protein WD904_10670 [Dehalococcoidia bacterium]